MTKGPNFLLAIGVCALMQISAVAQTIDATAVFTESSETPSSVTSYSIESLPGAELRAQLNRAKQTLKSASSPDGETVRLAIIDPKTDAVHLAAVSKDLFLTKGADLVVTSQLGTTLRLTVLRANGVNTAVTATDLSSGRDLTPLMVSYPIVRSGVITEVGHYTSAHPALLSTDVTEAGESYVTVMLDRAAKRLAGRGVHIPSDIIEIAQHLCIVEHTDHKRFKTEQHSELFPEILSLYALNLGDTYRYSVSTAGAGGMIQMIPRTYAAIREQHPNVPLKADFVEGMRDHDNALQAMLLYMNDTWNNLTAKSEVQEALRTGIATKPELLAAGYNSNPVRLPSYLKSGGANWRTLIPSETQMYLAIYKSLENNVKFEPAGEKIGASQQTTLGAAQPSTSALLSLLGRAVSIGSPLVTQLF